MTVVFRLFFWAVMAAMSTTFLVFTISASTKWREFILGYEYEQAYLTPQTDCYRDPSQNITTIDCATLYRLPWATDAGLCRYNEPYVYSDVVCRCQFLGQSRVYILTGLTASYNSWWQEFTNPGLMRNTTDPSEWMFANRRKDPLFHVFPSLTLCYDKSAVESNKCINDFIRQRRVMSIAYCWGPWCQSSTDGQPLWFNSGLLGLLLAVVAVFSYVVLFRWCVYLYVMVKRNGQQRQQQQRQRLADSVAPLADPTYRNVQF